MVILGVDLRASSSRTSAFAVLEDPSRLVQVGTFQADVELLKTVRAYRPSLIAIGSPLTLPAGLCCLELSCSCEPVDLQRKGRQLELDLARMGISCFFTNKRSIVRNLVYRGISLNRKLLRRGYSVVEVYPYATKLLLFGDKIPPKNSARSVDFMREHLPPLIDALGPHISSLDRNTCDALVNAYTALLHSHMQTDVLGTPEEGLLVLPRLPH